jgi:hypothetical protein
MTVTLEDCQKILGLSIWGHPVTAQAAPSGWRQRVEVFLGRLLPDDLRGSHTTGVPLTWLRQAFGVCPPREEEQPVGYHYRADGVPLIIRVICRAILNDNLIPLVALSCITLFHISLIIIDFCFIYSLGE